MATKSIQIEPFYKTIIRRNKNDMMDHFVSDSTKKITLPKYISAINKEFIYVSPKTDIQGTGEKQIFKFDFPGRDTLNIGRTHKNIRKTKTQLKGVNTNDKNVVSTQKYEGISDENNLFHLIFLSPLEEINNINEHFEFNRWWLGVNSNVQSPIGGSQIRNAIQNTKTTVKLKIKEGVIQTPKKLKEDVTLVEKKVIIEQKTLSQKTKLNKLVLDF